MLPVLSFLFLSMFYCGLRIFCWRSSSMFAPHWLFVHMVLQGKNQQQQKKTDWKPRVGSWGGREGKLITKRLTSYKPAFSLKVIHLFPSSKILGSIGIFSGTNLFLHRRFLYPLAWNKAGIQLVVFS